MIIAVKAHPYQKEEWQLKQTAGDIQIIWTNIDVPEADAYFDLCYEEYGAAFGKITGKPVFICSVLKTLNELPVNVSRINAWNGFLKRDFIEVVLANDDAKQVLDNFGWKYHNVPDVPGMIAPRTISMIINEAYFALGDEVSTKEEIDIAMKLGTNYPFGPFEWSEKIGLHNVYRLLKILSDSDERYQPAPTLEQELKSIA
jgi:3-hydroxybutyryl-CoA dehydrogenase